MSKKSIVVLGAGIAGMTAAYYAAIKGYRVTIIDEERYPGMRCSYANGGQVSVSNSEVWTTYNNIIKGFKWLLKKDAPLLIRPSLNLDKAIWLSKFLYHTVKGDYYKNTARTIRMGLEARKCYEEIVGHTGITFDQSMSGILHIYKNKKYYQAAIKATELYTSEGCEWTILNDTEVYNYEPSLKKMVDIVGGVWTKDDWTGDIHKFCVNLASFLEKQYDVRYTCNYKVNEISELRLYDYIIIANGVGAKKIAKTIGDHIPVYPVKGYSLTVPASDANAYQSMPKVSLLDDEAKIVTSLLGQRLRVAGTAEFAGENYDITRDRIVPLLKWLGNNFPDINVNEYSSWACLRPMTPNMMPITTRSKKQNNVFYHTGHGHLGWTLAPYTAKVLINSIEQT